MTRTTFHATLACFWLIIVTIIYLLALSLSAPLWVPGLFIAVATIALIKFSPVPDDAPPPQPGSSLLWPALTLLAGLGLIVHSALDVTEKYGHWDAWWFWNPRAAFLASQQYWKLAFSGHQFGTMFTVPLAHSDYPPFLPLLNGLCWRLMQMQPSVIPFGWSMFSLLLIASVLFLELYPRNRVIAIASLFFLTTQDHFIRIGTGQLADNWIALFLLLACISYHSFRQNRDPASAFWCGAMLGATLWTKNEGMILTAILLLFFIGDLIRYGGIRSFLAGIIIPLAALIWFKSALAPANDIVAAQSQWPWDKITDLSRYDDIRRQTWDMILLFFPAMPYLLTGYFVFCIFQKKKADPEIWALLLCAAAYLLVYLITPHNLGWHINTSADRLIFQLMPALLWIISRRICSVEFSLRATP